MIFLVCFIDVTYYAKLICSTAFRDISLIGRDADSVHDYAVILNYIITVLFQLAEYQMENQMEYLNSLLRESETKHMLSILLPCYQFSYSYLTYSYFFMFNPTGKGLQ